MDFYLAELCKLYYNEKGLSDDFTSDLSEELFSTETETVKEVYQCINCLSVYDDDFGDELNGVGPGVSFQHLPASYCCAVCETPKTDFVLVNYAADK
ncbi:Rubredoxin-2 [compost metagenome]